MAETEVRTMRRPGARSPKRRGRIRSAIARHPRIAGGTVVAVIAMVAFALAYFQPQKLFLNTTVNEALPSGPAASAPASPGAGASAPAAGPGTLASGSFTSLEHQSSGRALVVQVADGSRILRFEDLRTSNGPDLHVLLSTVPAGTDLNAYNDASTYVDLGSLKGNIGNQNYAIPASVDLSAYRSAVIWCKRFHVGFAVAPLGAP